VKETASEFIAKSADKATTVIIDRKSTLISLDTMPVVPTGKEQFTDLNLAREQAKNIKWKAIETLDRQLEKF
jgi:L-lactate dehydrogenase complex protein LldF